MTTCTQCHASAESDTLSYLGEALCQECADAEQDDGSDEALVEEWARENAAPGQVCYVRFDDLAYVVWPGDGRGWTAVPMDGPLDGVDIEEIKCK